MKANFIVNDYVLIWNLLFQASVSETIYKLKQKIWDTYKIEYNNVFKDKELILKDYKNFIPNDDTIYNIVLAKKDYEKIKQQTEKYRNELMKIWDQNKKETEYLYKEMIRLKVEDYTFFVVDKELNIVDLPYPNCMVVGREIDKKEPLKILLSMNMKIINKAMKEYSCKDESIKKAILELAVYNEYATRITKRSCYQSGTPALLSLKRWLYPYWLMYLGIPKEEFPNYMMRDKIVFDERKYAYEKELKKLNIEEFIDFCIRNQRYIIRG